MTTPATEPEADDLARLVEALESCALGGLSHRTYGNRDHPHYETQVAQDEDALLLAACALVRAVDELPPEDRPIGWDEYSYGPYAAPRTLP